MSKQSKIDAFIPYSREYFVSTYGPFAQNIIKLVEKELIPHYVSRLQEADFLDKIYIYSNDLKRENNLDFDKTQMIQRKSQTEKFSERAQLIDAVDRLGLSSFTSKPVISAYFNQHNCSYARRNDKS